MNLFTMTIDITYVHRVLDIGIVAKKINIVTLKMQNNHFTNTHQSVHYYVACFRYKLQCLTIKHFEHFEWLLRIPQPHK